MIRLLIESMWALSFCAATVFLAMTIFSSPLSKEHVLELRRHSTTAHRLVFAIGSAAALSWLLVLVERDWNLAVISASMHTGFFILLWLMRYKVNGLQNPRRHGDLGMLTMFLAFIFVIGGIGLFVPQYIPHPV